MRRRRASRPEPGQGPDEQVDGDRLSHWVVTAYALVFGSLLLVGGRVADLIGRRRAVLVGLAGFGLASTLGRAADSFTTLVLARALQGLLGALLAPATLAVITTTFTDPGERGSPPGAGARAATRPRRCRDHHRRPLRPRVRLLQRLRERVDRPATVGAVQQMGGSIGPSLVNTIAGTAAAGYLATRSSSDDSALAAAAVESYGASFDIAAAVTVGAAVVSAGMLRTRRRTSADDLSGTPA